MVFDKDIGDIILSELRKMHGRFDPHSFIAPRLRNKTLFEFLVGVMLSQNTSDRNAIRAYENLKRVLGGHILPNNVLSIDPSVIEESIRVAGMHKQRARRIVELARIFVNQEEANAFIEVIKDANVEEAREILMKLPGIGPKTADVVLLMYFGKPTFPVDTHIRRITWRLGYVRGRDYEEARRFWMNILKPENYLETHLLLITHGRKICRAGRPLCRECRLRSLCRYGRDYG